MRKAFQMSPTPQRPLAERNRLAMADAIRRWIADAQDHPQGAFHLNTRADWVEAQLQALDRAARRDEDPASHLVGLSAWDLSCALGDLRTAAIRLERQAAA